MSYAVELNLSALVLRNQNEIHQNFKTELFVIVNIIFIRQRQQVHVRIGYNYIHN